MTRIYCRTPSTGYPENLILADVPSSTMTTIPGANAPDYSVPDPSNQYEVRDPDDPARAILPGQIFFLTPLSCVNKTGNEEWIQCQLLTESGDTIQFGRIVVPAYDTGFFPIQGRSLLKRDANASNGDQLQVIASNATAFDVWLAAEGSPASQNLGVYTP